MIQVGVRVLPQSTVIRLSHRDGDILLITILDGTSKIMYCVESYQHHCRAMASS